MKFSISSLLISAAIAAVASADPASFAHVDVTANILGNCADCTQADLHALDVIISASANHYSKIAHVRLDNLMKEMSAASVTDGTEELPKEKALLMVAVQAKINDAKIACMPQALAPAIMTTIEAHADLHVPWSQKDQVEKKMADLNLLITDLVLDLIQVDINAELLSKECAEKMTNTEIVLVPVAAPETPLAPAPITEAPAPITEAPAPITDTPAPVTEAPAPIQEAPAPVIEASTPTPKAPASETPIESTQPYEDKPFIQVGIDVPADVDPKFVCKTGCKDSKDANVVLTLRVNLEKEFEPRLEHFYKQEVPTACDDERSSLLGGVLGLLSNLRVNVDAKAKVL
ncbi:hypothetical protein BG005_011753 [Podila minutissima]|nr:hypothetical protein BG005_011753 [Podila minutissima]